MTEEIDNIITYYILSSTFLTQTIAFGYLPKSSLCLCQTLPVDLAFSFSTLYTDLSAVCQSFIQIKAYLTNQLKPPFKRGLEGLFSSSQPTKASL